MTDKELINKAIEALKYSYSPYSEFSVGVALLCMNGNVYTGCNIENASFSATLCAERTAFAKALSEGVKDFLTIAIVGGKKGKITDFCLPCGVCRQVMAEFCSDNFKIIIFNGKETKTYTLNLLLPQSFGREDLC